MTSYFQIHVNEIQQSSNIIIQSIKKNCSRVFIKTISFSISQPLENPPNLTRFPAKKKAQHWQIWQSWRNLSDSLCGCNGTQFSHSLKRSIRERPALMAAGGDSSTNWRRICENPRRVLRLPRIQKWFPQRLRAHHKAGRTISLSAIFSPNEEITPNKF